MTEDHDADLGTNLVSKVRTDQIESLDTREEVVFCRRELQRARGKVITILPP